VKNQDFRDKEKNLFEIAPGHNRDADWKNYFSRAPYIPRIEERSIWDEDLMIPKVPGIS